MLNIIFKCEWKPVNVMRTWHVTHKNVVFDKDHNVRRSKGGDARHAKDNIHSYDSLHITA